ncbi:AbrB family transcriptional regulator [Carnobacterium divergens]|uniref:AbrB family transcriptional regulator n=1 Tax=Carnobacterium divergens TaxID=2748 RepID=A0AAW8R9C5_CARDV|nr:AbrB family transcriptional regulator [Carnobacterium divergens]MDT1956911.1 AbrB family transcriptional regulator [Carnobacterium divergens]MDT1972881.1 AbrB family transcriptional regulator [Carnobacterium divergens]
MLLTKSRKQGSSIVITLPPSNGEKPESDKEYLVIYAADGTIILVPKLNDPFTQGTEGEFYETDEWVDVSPEGRELF